jgi:hypothetical protein
VALQGLDLGRVLIHSVAAALLRLRSIAGLATIARTDDATHDELRRLSLDRLGVLSTLSPMPSFRRWLNDSKQPHNPNDETSMLRLAQRYEYDL